MATQAVGTGVGTEHATRSYARLAGICAILAGVGSLLYSVAFVFLKNVGVYSTLLLLGGLLTPVVLVALYARVRAAGAELAGLALLLGVVAAMATLSHGAYDLAIALHPEASPARAFMPGSADALAALPNPLDARGVMTFGVAGVAMLLFAWLVLRAGTLPRGLGYLGLLLGALLLVIYLGRLIVLDPTSATGTVAILAPAAVVGLLVNPAWLFWLGASLLRGRAA